MSGMGMVLLVPETLECLDVMRYCVYRGFYWDEVWCYKAHRHKGNFPAI